MGSGPRVAIDAMGGDVGPAVMIAGAALAYKRRADLSFILFGDEQSLKQELANRPELSRVSEIVHCEDVIAATDKPSQAIRRIKTTSMGKAILAVKEGDAQATVSAGNTGALCRWPNYRCGPCQGSTGRRSRPCSRRSAKTISSCSISAPTPNATPRISSSSR